jgi:colanic acid/amylovoran biosynthesis protein
MFFQTLLAIFSAILTKIGLGALYRRNFFSYINDCDLVVSCSDENYKEAASLLPTNLSWQVTWWTYIFYRTLEISIAKFLNKPIVMFPNSVGPFRTFIGRFLTRLSLNNCSYVLVREPFSYEIVKSLKITSRVIQTADIALLYKSGVSTLDSFSHPVLGVCPGIYSSSLTTKQVRKYISEQAAVLDSSIEEHGFNVVLSPHYISNLEYDDMEICNLIAQEMKNKDRVKIVIAQNVEDYKSILDKMDMVMVSKMHAGVLAISGYVPTLSLAYDHKQTGLFTQLSMKDCVIPITEASYEQLINKIRYIWKDRERIQESLKKRVPELQETTIKGIKEALEAFLPLASKP